MKDYQELLNKFSGLFETRNKIVEYLDKYWLVKKELDDYWLKIKRTIYNNDFKSLPDTLFNENFEAIILKGGAIFTSEEFESLRFCMSKTSDKYFVVLEHYYEDNPPGHLPPPYISWPPLRFKFPANVTFDEIFSGDLISDEVFNMPERNYFVFGDSGKWGKYVGNDYEYPLNIIGFDKRYSNLFKSSLNIPPEDIDDLKKWTAFYGIKLHSIE